MATDYLRSEPGRPEIPRNRAIGVAAFFTVLLGLEALFFAGWSRGWLPAFLMLSGIVAVILIWLTADRTRSRAAVAGVGLGFFLLILFL